MSNNLSTTQLRGYETLKALFGYEVNGVTCTELARLLNRTSSVVIKDLLALQHAGFAEQLPNKNWRLSTALAREAIKIFHAVDSAKQRVDEAAQRYGVKP